MKHSNNNEVRRLADLKAHPENGKIYGEEAVDQELVESIKQNGLIEPLVVTSNDVVLSGHRRLRAATAAGLNDVEVRVVPVSSRADELAIIIEANRQRQKTNYQLAQEARTIMAIERERAKERMVAGGQGGVKRQDRSPSVGQARDLAGKQLNVSGRHVARLVKSAEAIDALERAGDIEAADTVKAVLNKKGPAAACKLDEVKRVSPDAPVEEPRESAYIMLGTWKTMPEEARCQSLHVPKSNTTFLRQKTDSIDWAAWSWNPVSGCLHECPYCYAADLANRYYGEQGFNPTFYPERLHAPANTKVPWDAAEDIRLRNVFTCSMADLFGKWVPQEWIDAVLDVMNQEIQWNYLMLTKFPQRLAEQVWPQNAWVGATVDSQARVDLTVKAFERVKEQSNAAVTWLSLEPLLEPLEFPSLEMFDMVVIGGASRSSRTPEWIPPAEWYEMLLWQARKDDCHVYMKENLRYRPQEYPGHTPSQARRAPDEFFAKRSKLQKAA